MIALPTPKLLVTLGLLCCTMSHAYYIHAAAAEPDDNTYARNALSDDITVRNRAAQHLRARGEAGLKLLFDTHPALIEQLKKDPEQTVETRHLAEVLDAVAAQKDAYSSGLYWHTSGWTALGQSAATGRPILALHLLGNLDDEMSCANSRFFRTILYADPTIAAFMRENFVLQWITAAKVPVMTVKFGDGREMTRTMTGNSYHEVVNTNGDVLDVLPGMVSPGEFLEWLKEVAHLSTSLPKENSARTAALMKHHRVARETMDAAFAKTAEAFGLKLAPGWLELKTRELDTTSRTPHRGRQAAMLAVSKAMTEQRFLDSYTRRRVLLRDDDVWATISGGARGNVEIAPEALAVMNRKRVVDPEVPMWSFLNALTGTIAEDTARNQYLLHRTVHLWGEMGRLGNDCVELQERMYREVFLTPLDDPWMNLAPSDIYVGLPNGGVRVP